MNPKTYGYGIMKDIFKANNYQRIVQIRKLKKSGVDDKELIDRFGARNVNAALNTRYREERL